MTIQVVDVYHSGDNNRLRAPFLLASSGSPKAMFPPLAPGRAWIFWKQVPITVIAVQPLLAAEKIKAQGYFLQ